MQLKDLIKNIEVLKIPVLPEGIKCTGVAFHSGKVVPGNIFVAIGGLHYSGLEFIEDAIYNGAICIVSDKELECEVPIVLVKDAQNALADLAALVYGNPAKALSLVGITGTNGKTTVSYLVESIFKAAGKKTGLIGTIEYRVGEEHIDAPYTTPDAVMLNDILSKMKKAECTSVIMEISSHALAQKRVRGLEFDIVVFTNLSIEHLDYHYSMEEYLKVKCSLFAEYNRDKKSVVNIDDPYAQEFLNAALDNMTYGFAQNADVHFESYDATRGVLLLNTPLGELSVVTSLKGKHNIYNLMAAVAVAISAECSVDDIQNGVAALSGVEGRMEFYSSAKGVDFVVDYAHTDDALRKILESLKEMNYNKIISVFGCGGDRDKGKRALMGKVSATLSDYSILTTDNPRYEDPEMIIEEIEKGFRGKEDNYSIVTDRKSAIVKAYEMAKAGDCVLVSGKGHEKYQDINGVKIFFSDQKTIKEIIGDK